MHDFVVRNGVLRICKPPNNEVKAAFFRQLSDFQERIGGPDEAERDQETGGVCGEA